MCVCVVCVLCVCVCTCVYSPVRLSHSQDVSRIPCTNYFGDRAEDRHFYCEIANYCFITVFFSLIELEYLV